MFNLGCCYSYGKGTRKDQDKAVELYKQAVAKGNAEAMTNLAYTTRNTSPPPPPLFFLNFLLCNLFRKVAETMTNLAYTTRKTFFVCFLFSIFFFIYLFEVIIHSVFEIYIYIYYDRYCYQNGWGVDTNQEEAVALYTAAVDRGDSYVINIVPNKNFPQKGNFNNNKKVGGCIWLSSQTQKNSYFHFVIFSPFLPF